MARGGKICIDLNFIRSGEGRSRRAKIKSFWEFINAQKDLVPLHPFQTGEKLPAKDSSSDDDSNVCEINNCQGDEISQQKSLRYDELRIFKELGLDRVALAASDDCKRCLKNERNDLDKEPELADSVVESKEELNAEIKAFQERVKHEKPKFAYKDPGKYQHLIQ